MDNELLQAIGQMMDSKLETIKADMAQLMDEKLTAEREHSRQTIEQSEERIRILIETDVTKRIDLVLEGHAELDARICELRSINDKVEDIQTTVEVLKHLTVKN